jgi:hypothetical protein
MLHMCRYEDRYIRVHGGSVLILGSWAVESAALACVRRPLVGYSIIYSLLDVTTVRELRTRSGSLATDQPTNHNLTPQIGWSITKGDLGLVGWLVRGMVGRSADLVRSI